MNQTQDEHITCASCGASFVFTAAEAQIFAERNLVAPKRCKACRKARKEQGRGPAQSAPRGRFPRSTGDVNEYRSPMSDPSFNAMTSARPRAGDGFRQDRRPPRPRRPFGPRDDGAYRAPSFPEAARAESAEPHAPRGDRPPRKRRGETFAITCNGCGKSAEVPFKPAEGRDVFCQDCYRARKPTAPKPT